VNDLLQIGLTNALLATILAVVAALTTAVCRRPALSHALWLVVLVKLLTPPLVVIPLTWPQHEAKDEPSPPVTLVQAPAAPLEKDPLVAELPPAPNDAAPEEAPPRAETPPPLLAPVIALSPPEPSASDAEPAWVPPDVPWVYVVGGVWLTGTLLWFLVAGVRMWRFHRLQALAAPAPPELQSETNRLAARFGLRDCPGVWLMPGTWSPLLWAVAGYPRLLLPAGLLARLDNQQRATLLAHELAHYYRRDHWVRCLEFAALGLYWWLPIAWWVRRELSDAEEECCDAWVVWALPEAAKAYASALVETLDFLSGSQPALPPVASGLGRLPLLRRRLTMIMRGTTPRKLTGLGFLTVLAAAALLLPLWPSWAQDYSRKSTTPDLPQTPPDLKRTADELAKLKQYLDMLKDDYEKKAAALREAEMREAEKAKALTRKAGPATIESRLAEIERKLDLVLGQVRDLQKQLGKKGPAAYPGNYYPADPNTFAPVPKGAYDPVAPPVPTKGVVPLGRPPQPGLSPYRQAGDPPGGVDFVPNFPAGQPPAVKNDAKDPTLPRFN
jgi:beta-lactamase regulating signal transducer with metallopeptidase domain